MRTLQQRFDEKYEVDVVSGCWEWIAGLRHGYGLIWDGNPVGAHRVSFRLHRGSIPDGLCVLHHCDKRPCVNPAHLFLGTKADNATDRDKKGRLGPHKGVFNGNAKLTDAQVLEIRASGRTPHSLAKQFGVTHIHIYSIFNRKTWKHI